MSARGGIIQYRVAAVAAARDILYKLPVGGIGAALYGEIVVVDFRSRRPGMFTTSFLQTTLKSNKLIGRGYGSPPPARPHLLKPVVTPVCFTKGEDIPPVVATWVPQVAQSPTWPVIGGF